MYNKALFSDLYEKRRYSEAHDLCDDAIKDNQNDFQAYHDKAKLFAREKKWEDALSYIDRAIALANEPVLFFNKARWLLQHNCYKETIESSLLGLAACEESSFYYYEQSLLFFKAYSELKCHDIVSCQKTLKKISYNSGARINNQNISRQTLEEDLERIS